MKITQLIPCSDWYYAEQDDNSEWSVTPVAAWALTSEGESVGMIPVSGTRNNSAFPKYPHLEPAPPCGGRFVHETKLTDKQRSAAKRTY
ncbi:hypothetical protein [Pseudomonas fluorescens]|uniref:hypothetical protein n=1 Tax=Pseudomonas fluorescens TaxID=294 RepID=UPI0012DA2646|nr:hypothetical protein [Pseudomonas fluorescens]